MPWKMSRLPQVAKVQQNKVSRGADGMVTVVTKVAAITKVAVMDAVETLGIRVGMNTPLTHRGSSSSINKEVVQMPTPRGVEVDILHRTTPGSFISPP